MDHSYEKFRELVKEDLKKMLAVHKLSEDELEAYVVENEEEIKGGYRHYLNPYPKDDREDDIRFTTGASTVGYCLWMSY